MRLLSAIAVLFSIAAAAAAVEVPVHAGQSEGVAPYIRSGAIAVSSADGALLLWVDSRSTHGASRADVVGQYIDRDGQPVGANFLVVSERGGSVWGFAAARSGADVILAYSAVTAAGQAMTKFLRLSSSATVTLPARIADGFAYGPLMAAGDLFVQPYWVRVSDVASTYHLAVIDASGSLLNQLQVTVDASHRVTFTALPSGNIFAAWVSSGDGVLHTAVFDRRALLDPHFTPIDDHPGPRDIVASQCDSATSGRQVLVVCGNLPLTVNGQTATYVVQPFALDGTAAGSAVPIAAGNEWWPVVSWTGSDYLLAAPIDPKSRTTTIRLSESGQVLGVSNFGTASFVNAMEASAFVPVNGGTLLIAHEEDLPKDNLAPDYKVTGRVIAPGTAQLGDGIVYSRSLPDQYGGAVAACGDGSYVVGWAETDRGGASIYVRELGTLRKVPAAVPAGSGPWEDVSLSVACNDRTIVVGWTAWDTLWYDNRGFSAAIDRATGVRASYGGLDRALLGPTSTLWNGSAFIVAWQNGTERETVFESSDKNGRFIGMAQLRHPPLDSTGHHFGDAAPALAWTGSNYCFAWQHETVASPQYVDVAVPRDLMTAPLMASLFLNGGHVVDTDVTPPAVAFDGSRCVVAWTQAATLKFASMDADGTVSQPMALATVADGTHVSIANVAGRIAIGSANHVYTVSGASSSLLAQYADDADVSAVAPGDHLMTVLTRTMPAGGTRLFTDGFPEPRSRAIRR